jgi:membrane-bound metal-dependent hydrolase YbcI (DUF457 family)
MPLPLGHIAIGLTTNEFFSENSSFTEWRIAAYVAILANLPDIDVPAGLLLQGNGSAFHRGPTHSVLFALLAAILAANAWKLWALIPKLGFRTCFLIILSHTVADFFLTKSPVSFLWPLEVNWAGGYSGWGEVLVPVFLEAYRDAGVIIVCLFAMVLRRAITQMRQHAPFSSLAYRTYSLRKDREK